MKLHYFTILDRRGEPTYQHTFTENENLEYEFLAHTSSDIIQERLQKSTDLYLGCLQTVGELTTFGYVTNTGSQMILITDTFSTASKRDPEVTRLFEKIHMAHVSILCNPFYQGELAGGSKFDKFISTLT